MKIIDWNHERKRTRDRLIEYSIIPTFYDINLLYLWKDIIEEIKLSKNNEEEKE